MSLFQIRKRIFGDVLFEIDLSADVAASSSGYQLGFAVRAALKSGADLRGAVLRDADLRDADLSDADLSGADLRGAVLSDADLRGADLSGADLRDADLSGADLRGADLRDADLSGADLRGAVLRDADLSDADLRGADLRGADLRDADLSGADLRDADLRGAVLSDADLSGADLRGAVLRDFRQDLILEVLKVPNEIIGLRLAIVEGRIDGSTYSGQCACLAGTIANLREIDDYSGSDIDAEGLLFTADATSPRERWFMGIRPGDTPESNPMAKLALEWIDEAIAIRNHIVSTAKLEA